METENHVKYITDIAKRIAERIEARARLAECTDFSDAEMVETLGQVPEEINELLELEERFLGPIMAKQICANDKAA